MTERQRLEQIALCAEKLSELLLADDGVVGDTDYNYGVNIQGLDSMARDVKRYLKNRTDIV